MRYCVIKNTTKVIDGSDNSIDVMLQNARNAGFSEDEIEILTEKEYEERVKNEPKSPQKPTQEERLEALEMAVLELVLGGEK